MDISDTKSEGDRLIEVDAGLTIKLDDEDPVPDKAIQLSGKILTEGPKDEEDDEEGDEGLVEMRYDHVLHVPYPASSLEYRMMQFVNKPAFERDTLGEAMAFFGIKHVRQSIYPWISPNVILKPHSWWPCIG